MTPPLFVPALGRSLYPGASVALDFTRNLYRSGTPVVKGSPSLLSGWTFTRASTGYAETAAGALVAFASGAPRITDKGLLVEEARTNLLTYSQDFDNAAWDKTISGTGILPVVTANDAVAPDGTMTADKIVLSLAGGTTSSDQSLLVHSTFSTVAASTYSGTVYVLGTVGEKIALRHVGAAEYTIHTFTGAWDRISKIDAAAGTSSTFDLGLRGGIGGVSNAVTFWAWGADCELGAFPTSYIPTTTASATRAADDAVITGLSVLDGCTFVQRALAPAGVSTDARSSLNDGSSNNQFLLYYSGTTLSVFQVIAGGSPATAQTGTAAAGATLNSAANSLGANMRASVNGGAVGAAAVGGSMPTLTRLDIGKSAVSSFRYWNNYVRQIIIYPTVFTDAQLVAASL